MNTEILNKNTGISLALLMKIIGGVVAVLCLIVPFYTNQVIFDSKQQARIDADIIPNVAKLVTKDEFNDVRFSKIEVQTEDYKENKMIWKQMAKDMKELKDYIIK